MKKRGFTLIELLAVIAIIGILATIGVTAVVKIYNDSIKKTMIVQENNVAEASRNYLEDYCIDPLDNSYKCPSSYENNSETRYICLSDLQDNEKDNYVSKVNYKNEECKGIIVFSKNDDGDYIKAKTYLYCDYDSNNKKYNYITDETLDTSKYPRCNIASGITDPEETTSTTTTTTTTTTTKKTELACTFNGNLMQGSEYTYGPYTYRYKQEGISSSSGLAWQNMTNDGWGVQLSNKSSSAPITEAPCTSINSKKVTSYAYLYDKSAASSINVTFNSRNVTNMARMFKDTKATSINLTSLNTSNVINMESMFEGSTITSLNLNNFNTSNVVSMISMFQNSKATSLVLTSFNTKYVKDMTNMFSGSAATSINVSSFNTSNVASMSGMFSNTKATTLDLSSFNTSKVTNMSYMFNTSSSLKTIYASSNFVTTRVSTSTNMFNGLTNIKGGMGTKYNNSKKDKSYARIDTCATPGYFTDKNGSSLAGGSFATDSWATIISTVKAGNSCKYKVGDTKTISMGTYGTHTVRIANISTPSACSKSGFSQTACGFVVEFADIITTHNINSTAGVGWPATSMRTFINNDIYNTLPSDLRSGIINTITVSGHGNSNSSNFTSTDKLYLLAPKEVYTNWSSSYDTAKDLTRTLDYYVNIGVTTSNYSKAIKKNGTTSTGWWFRTANADWSNTFYGVGSGGASYYAYLTLSDGVSPAFRIG